MKKLVLLFGLFFSVLGYAQASDKLYQLAQKIEAKYKLMTGVENFDFGGQQFYISKNFDDHSERHILDFKDSQNFNLVEIIEDKSIGKTYSNVFNGDYFRNKNTLNVRATLLEEREIAVPVTHTFFLMITNDGEIYLKDVNTNERWLQNKSNKK